MQKFKNDYEGFSPLTIKYVKPGSIGDELGLKRNDRIIKINDKESFDELDYYYFTSQPVFTLEILKADGTVLECEIETDDDEGTTR